MGTDLATIADALTTFVPRVLAATNTPGAALAIADSAGALSTDGFGLADLVDQVLVTPDTVFQGGSMAKPYIAVAVLQLAQRSVLNLNAPVNHYLRDFEVTNPHGGDVTLLSLLTHSSGLRTHGYDATQHLPPPLPDYLRSVYERARGREYHGGPLWTAPVGSRYQYSTLGMATLAHVVQLVTRCDYADYVAEHIFSPLAMSATAVTRDYAPTLSHATGYLSLGSWSVPSPVLQSATYPATRLETTAADAVRLPLALLNSGVAPSGRILTPEAVSDMLTLRYSGELPGEPRDLSRVGLAIQLRNHDTPPWYGHGGAYPFDFSCECRAYPHTGVAVAVLCNAWDGVRYVNPATRSPAGLIARYVGALAAQDSPPRPPRPRARPWDNPYAMGLLIAERIRGLLGDPNPLPQDTVTAMLSGTRTLSRRTPDPAHAAGFAAGVRDINALPVVTPAALRAFLRDDSPLPPAELDVAALSWGASRAHFPVPMAFWADLSESPTPDHEGTTS